MHRLQGVSGYFEDIVLTAKDAIFEEDGLGILLGEDGCKEEQGGQEDGEGAKYVYGFGFQCDRKEFWA